jgi:hypothetical protein
MDKSTKILIGGMILAVLVVVGGKSRTYWLESKLHQLEASCGNPKKVSGGPVCEAKAFVTIGAAGVPEYAVDPTPLQGIQAEIVATQIEIWNSGSWCYMLAAAILVLSCFPFAWYFFLRRLRELRTAIVGK